MNLIFHSVRSGFIALNTFSFLRTYQFGKKQELKPSKNAFLIELTLTFGPFLIFENVPIMTPLFNPKFNQVKQTVNGRFSYHRKIRRYLFNMLDKDYPDDIWEIFHTRLIPLIEEEAPWNNIRAVFLKIESLRLDWRYPRP